jgi:hypothetical protein
MANYPSYNLTGKYLGYQYPNFAGFVTGSNVFTDGTGNSTVDFNVFNFPVSKTGSYLLNCNTASVSITASVGKALLGVKNSLFKKGDSTVPAFIADGEQSLITQTSLMVYINYNTVVNFPISTSISMPSPMLGGNDYGIYATFDNNLIATSCSYSGYTTPAGYTSTNSKLIGGFYFSHSGSSTITTTNRGRTTNIASVTASAGHGLVTGDIVDVTLMTDTTYNSIDIPITVVDNVVSYANVGSNEGNTADTAGRLWKVNDVGVINQYSLWDLKFRPNCSDPRGMVLVDNRFWCDIYLTGVNYNSTGSSHKGAKIADGENAASYPVRSPALGGNGTTTYTSCTWFEASEVASYVGKTLLSYEDHTLAGYGATEAASFGVDPVVTCRCIGYTSKWGIEQMNGVMRVWGRDLNFRFDLGDGTTRASTNRSRNGGIATVSCSVAHGFAVGDVVSITTLGGTGYNKGTTVLGIPSGSVFTYYCSGSNENPTADTAGVIAYGPLPVYTYLTSTNSRGRMYIQGPYGLTAGLYGGYWGNGTYAGSRCSIWSACVWNNNNGFGLRCRCDHTVIP